MRLCSCPYNDAASIAFTHILSTMCQAHMHLNSGLCPIHSFTFINLSIAHIQMGGSWCHCRALNKFLTKYSMKDLIWSFPCPDWESKRVLHLWQLPPGARNMRRMTQDLDAWHRTWHWYMNMRTKKNWQHEWWHNSVHHHPTCFPPQFHPVA